MSLTRRRLLRAAGGAGLVGLAGCFGDDAGPSESADAAETSAGVGDLPQGTVRTLDRGCADRRRTGIEATWAEEVARVEGRIAAPTPQHDATVESVERRSDAVRLVVGVRDRYQTGRDCDGLVGYEATVKTTADGPDRIAVEHATDGTALLARSAGGPTPTVGATDFDTRETSCGSPTESRTDISFEETSVLVSGVQAVPDPCYEAVSGSARAEGDRLVVSVEAASALRPQESCLQCRGLVSYQGRIDVDGPDGLSGVLVRHGVV